MEQINRCLAILLPRQPYVDWLNSLRESRDKIWSLQDFNDQGFAYLIPEYSQLSDMRKYVQDNFQVVFEDALSRGLANEDRWPSKRGRETFEAWFEVEIHSRILDLSEEPLRVRSIRSLAHSLK